MKIWIAILLVSGGAAVGYTAGHWTHGAGTTPPQHNVDVRSTGAPKSVGFPDGNGAATPLRRLSPPDLFAASPDDPLPAPAKPMRAPQYSASTQIPEDPLQHYTYTGSVTFGDQVFAVLLDDRTNTEGIYLEGDNLENGVITEVAPDVVTVHQGAIDRHIEVADNFNPIPMVATAPKDVLPNPGNLTAFRDKTYQSFYFQVTGQASGTVWGSRGTYTDDSQLSTAAVHSGALRDGEAGIVHVTVLPGYDHYDGATSNGVTSQSYAQWQGSYRVDRL